MSTSQWGILTTFDHTVDSWNTYKRRIGQWFLANNIDEASDAKGEKRRAILLSSLTNGTFQLASDLALPNELQEVSFKEILLLLDSHFTPKRCGFGERCKFYAASQQFDETPTQWAARLRGLTAHCGFSDVNEALRDRYVMGMLPGPERDKLFTYDVAELTFAKAIDLAETLRSARGASAAASTRFEQQPDQVNRIKQKNARVTAGLEKCSVCGLTNHTPSECRFAKYRCKKCNMEGHLRRVCKSTVNHVNTDNVGKDDDGKILKISCSNGEPMYESVTVLGILLKFEIDSGSAVTVISSTTYNNYFSSVPLSPTDKKLFTYVGHKMKCAGLVRLPVTYSGQTHELKIYVVHEGGPPLLGRDFISLFKLEFVPCKYLGHGDNLLENLQSKFPEVFSDKLGAFNKYKVKLQLKPDSQPIFFKARPVAFALKDKINMEIDRLVQLGILKPVEHAEYASPIVPVLKRNGSLRLCVDYSVSINKQLIVEQYPLPTVQELFTRLHGGQQFSKLDLSMAYNQFLLDEESQNLTCINTHRGLFKYTRMVFGLSSAPSIFQKAMECVLADMDGVLCFLDDVLVTGPDREIHLERLTAVIKRLQEAGLVLQKEKCEFFRDDISYLGYKIDKHGLQKSPDKIKAILDAPVPTNVSKLQSFLGLVNYYRNFVKNASSILSPLYDLLKKEVKWNWSPLHSKSFNEIKQILASEQVLAHFNPNAKLILTVDASPTGLGAVLSQIEPEGTERPISFASRTLNAAEKKYAQIQKEATAIIFGVRRFHQYLYGRSVPFVLRTDHKPLISIFGPHKGIPDVSANRLQRYALFLSGYNYTIEYIRSNENCADYLSRASLPDALTLDSKARKSASSFIEDDPVELQAIEDRAAYVNFVIDGSFPVTLAELREETRKDALLAKVVEHVLNGWPGKVTDLRLKPYFCCRLELSYENGCLMRGHKVVLPERLRLKVCMELHASHLGIVKTKAAARARFWFPGVDDVLENIINSCNVCTQLKASPPRAPISPWEYPSHPFHRIHIDFLGPFNGKTFLVLVDAYSKWVEAYDMKGTSTTSAVIDKLCEFMSRFGLPKTIVSDNGTAFVSEDFKKFCSSNGISHLTSPTYHPASNGQAESYVKIVKKGIKACILSNCNERERNLKLLKYLFDYRNSVHSTTGFSPAQLVFGKNLRSRLDLFSTEQTLSSSIPNVASNVEKKQSSQIKAHGGKNKQSFSIGEQVLYKSFTNNKNVWNKGVIVKRIGKVMYVVKDNVSSLKYRKHKNQLTMNKGSVFGDDPFWECGSVGEVHPHPGVDAASEFYEASDSSQQPSPSTASGSSPAADNVTLPVGEEEQEEFYEASDSACEPEIQRNHPSSRVQLRQIPRVDYKSLASV